MKDSVHFLLVEFLGHENVVSDSSVHDPGLLRAVGSGSAKKNLGLREMFGLIEEWEEESRFTAGCVAEEKDEFSFRESYVDVSEDNVQIWGEGGFFFGKVNSVQALLFRILLLARIHERLLLLVDLYSVATFPPEISIVNLDRKYLVFLIFYKFHPDILFIQKLLYSGDGGLDLNEVGEGIGELPERVLHDAENHDDGKGGGWVDGIASEGVGEKGEKYDEGTAEGVQEAYQCLEYSSGSIGGQLSPSFIGQLLQEVVLKNIGLNIFDIRQQFLGLFGPLIFQFQPHIVGLGNLLAKAESEVQ